MVGRRLIYVGQVQGVGFRATCARFARGFAVAGWVRNLPTGEVELVVEGDGPEVTAFLDRIATHFRDHITEARSEDRAAAGSTGFEIRR